MTLQQVKATVEELRAARSSFDAVALSIESVLKEGLKGNRAVNGDLWSVVMAAARAFPIQLGPGVEKAQAVVQASAELDLARVWILQAISDGSLITLLQNLRSQPQIFTAYDSKAPVRSAAASRELISLVKELQELITETPYELYLQQKTAQKRPSDAPLLLIRVQTEEDLPQNGHHHSSSGSSGNHHHQQQQQVTACSVPPIGLQGKQEGVAAPSSSRSPAAQAAAAPAGIAGVADGEQQQKLSAAAGAAAAVGASQRLGKKLLMGAFARNGASSSSTVRSSINSPEQQGNTAPDSQLLVQLQLQAVDEGVKGLTAQHLDQPPQQQKHMVKAQITAAPGPNSSSSSSSSFLSGRTSAVKGFLHNLQQSASSSMQQSAAAAAGHDITGAVAAAGGAVAAAIGQPFSAVKGFAAATYNRSDPKGSSSSSPKGGLNASSSQIEARTAAGSDPPAAAATSRSSSLHLPRFLQSKQPAAAAVGGGGGGGSVAANAPIAAASSGSTSTPHCQVRLQLVVTEDPASDQPVSCIMKTAAQDESSTAAKESSAAAGDVSTPSTAHGWGAKSLMQKLASRAHSSTEPKQQQQQQQQHPAVGDPEPTSAAAAGDTTATATTRDVLEGDMWSVMARLRSSSTSNAAATAAAALESLPSPAAAAAAAGVQQLEQSALDLLQLLLSSCSQLTAAAAAARGCLGDESPELLQFIGLIKQLLNHGLKVSSSSHASGGGGGSSSSSKGSVPAALTHWLSQKNFTAFEVLQALQHGSKQHPRLMLGADNISNMQAAKALSSTVKLDLWVRSSLNEQLLGVRISTLLVNAAALAQYYLPQALLLQQQQMQEVLQQLVVLSGYKFVLLVEAPAPAAAAASDGSSVSAAASAAAVRDLSSNTTTSSSSSKGSVMDPRRLLGGFSKSFTAFKSSSNSTSSATAAAATAAACDQTAVTAQRAATGGSSSSIPTFLWAPLGSSSSSTPSDPSAAGNASILKRGQRRLANILEVRVPPPDSAAVLSPENSCALSPVSTPGDAAYAEWWSPNSSWQDLQALGALVREGPLEGVTPNIFVSPDGEQSISCERLGSVELSGGSSGGRSAVAVVAVGSSGHVGRISAEISGLGSGRLSEQPSSEAARKIEEELSAAMSTPMQVLLDQRRRRGSSSIGGGRIASRGAALHRSSSSGWDAAVAAARARSRSAVGTSVGVSSRVNVCGVNLHRRSRSPEANWPAAGSGNSTEGSGRDGVAAAETQGVVSAVANSRVIRHRHKRSSSLNDLPELAALLDSGDTQV